MGVVECDHTHDDHEHRTHLGGETSGHAVHDHHAHLHNGQGHEHGPQYRTSRLDPIRVRAA
jgi:hypothetical protein